MALEKLGGHSLKHLFEAESFASFVAPASFEFVITNFTKFVLNKDYQHSYTFFFIRADGQHRLCEKYMMDYTDKFGKRFLAISMTDITERKQMERLLEKKLVALTCPLDKPEGITFEELFDLEDMQQIQDKFSAAMGVASIITRPDGTPLTRPSNFCRLCNNIIRCTEVGKKNCFSSDAQLGRYHPDGPIIQPCLSGGLWDAGASITVGDRHVANWLVGQVRDETQSEEKMCEYARTIGADESDFIAAFREVPSMSRSQFEKIAKALFIMANQLSTTAYHNVQQARYIAEQQENERKLKNAYAFLDNLIGNIPDPVFVKDRQHRWVILNDAMCVFMGKSREELINKSDYDFFPKDEADIFWQKDEQVFITKETNVNEESFTDAANKQHTIITKKSYFEESPDKVFLIGIIRDVTEQKEREKEKSLIQAQLIHSAKLASIGTLAAGVAHEINNPVVIISGFAKRMAEAFQDSKDSEHAQSIQIIQKASAKIEEIVNGLRTYARQDVDLLGSVDVHFAIKDTLLLVQGIFAKENIQIETKLNANKYFIKANMGKLQQVIMNIISNAKDALVESSQGQITISTSNIENMIEISISDNGMGMSSSILSQIFDPFFTTKEPGKGTGLGLSICQTIIESFGGKISVQSEIGKGTKFSIIIKNANLT